MFICSSEKTTSYRRTSSGSQGKSSAPSPGCAGSQEELYCSPVGVAPNHTPPPANANANNSVPVILPPPRSRKNAMVKCHLYFEKWEIFLLNVYILYLLVFVCYSFTCEHKFIYVKAGIHHTTFAQIPHPELIDFTENCIARRLHFSFSLRLWFHPVFCHASSSNEVYVSAWDGCVL